jgi:hypothetical protein
MLSQNGRTSEHHSQSWHGLRETILNGKVYVSLSNGVQEGDMSEEGHLAPRTMVLTPPSFSRIVDLQEGRMRIGKHSR